MLEDPLQIALDYVWNWQDSQLKGRIQAISFYVASVSFMVAAYVAAITATKSVPGVAAGIAFVGGVGSSLAFGFIDKRFSESMKIGEDALRLLEEKLRKQVKVN